MGAAERIIANPPKIDWERLKTYRIGSEPDSSRTAVRPNTAIAFLVGQEAEHLHNRDEWYQAFERSTAEFERQVVVLIGPQRPHTNPLDEIYFIEMELPSSPLEILTHLAVKLALNNVSSATMGKLGRLSGNWMAHVDASNKKLIDRSIRLVSELAEVDYPTACYALFESLEELNALPESKRKTVSPAAYTVKRLRAADGER
jgi:N-acetylmuramic acid 6-phosphate etherase